MNISSPNILLILLCSNIYNTSQGQTCPVSVPNNCTNTPFNGNLNLVNTIYSSYSVQSGVPYYRSSTPNNYGDVIYVGDDNYNITTCKAPDANDCIPNATGRLIYDVYYPTGADYISCPLPAVIVFHAGGFIECTNKNQVRITTICEELAKRGFVVFNVEYRTGRITTTVNAPNTTRDFTTVQQQLAAYRGLQDVRGAIRSIIKRAIDGDFDNLYRIDYNNIFIGGASAGALMAMNAAWYNAQMVYDIFPADASSITIQQALGSINANYYHGLATLNYQQYIKGTFSISGAIGIPLSFDTNEYDFFNPSLLKPHIGFHGKRDPVFPYADGVKQRVYFAPPPTPGNTDFNAETLCVNGQYTLNTTDITGEVPDQINGSALNMRKILNYHNLPNELYLDCDALHEPFQSGVLTADYGTGATTIVQASTYMAQRIATFFQAVLSGRAGSIGTSYFPDCPNTRYGCNTQTTPCSGCTTNGIIDDEYLATTLKVNE